MPPRHQVCFGANNSAVNAHFCISKRDRQQTVPPNAGSPGAGPAVHPGVLRAVLRLPRRQGREAQGRRLSVFGEGAKWGRH